ncbi:MAG TPA: SDR family NAD(P)-dependent oxidoreductase [Gaiellales bacterium]|nr:SDR family NAD(P)-dependent oxidoreductase [Gaiellales bacterium]
MRYPGAVVWITGASSGIGESLARELAGRGARVAITARRGDRLDAIAGDRMLSVPADVTDLDAMRAAAARVEEELGPIDLAVLNAGTWRQMDVTAWDTELFRLHVETNLMGMVHGIDAVLPGMRRRRGGVIAGVSSVAGYRGWPSSEAYGSTKAAEINLLESLRIDLLPLGIRVLTVCPGFVRSDLTSQNTFRMPFLMEPPDAAARIADGIAREKAELVFPLPMMLLMKATRLVPVRPWAALMSRHAKTRRNKGV